MYIAVHALMTTLIAVIPASVSAGRYFEPARQNEVRSKSVPFKVAGKWERSVCVLVAPTTSDQQLAALVNEFRQARASGTLGRLLPATTPNGSKGPFGIVQVFIMSDPK